MNKQEKKRIERKTEIILNILRDAGSKGVTNAEMSKVALRYGGCLGALYRDGYKINKVSLGEGLYNYILISEPQNIIEREKAIDVFLSEVQKRAIVDRNTLEQIMEQHNIAVKYKANTYKK